MSKLALDLYILMISAAIPFAVVFAVGNLIVGSFLRAAFGGKLEFKI